MALSIIITIVVVAAAAVGGWLSHKKFGDDNIIEEACESVIESQTGVDVDLTPDSPEKK